MNKRNRRVHDRRLGRPSDGRKVGEEGSEVLCVKGEQYESVWAYVVYGCENKKIEIGINNQK